MHKNVLAMAMTLAAGQGWAASTIDTVVQAKVLPRATCRR